MPTAVERTDCCIPMDLECAVSDCTKDVSSTVNDAVAVLDAFYVNGNALEDNPLLEPCMGMKFESEKALFSFYQDYAIRLGFSITISSRRRSRTNSTIIAGVYACSRYGYKKPSERKYRPRPTFKTGCKAMIKAKRMETGTWTILEVVKDHNHELDPNNVRVHAFTYEDEGNSGVRNLAAMENSEPSLGGDGIEGSDREIITTGVLESEPFIGLEFECEDAGFSFYSEYARFMGFNIITKSRRRSKIDKTLISGLYACSKNGYKMPNENVKFPRPSTRIGCKAMLKVKKLDSGRWIVLDFIKEHNHELSPERGQIFQPHKGIQTGGKNALRNRCASKVRSNKLYSLLSRQSVRRRKALVGKEGHNDAGKVPSFLTAEVIQSIYDYFAQVHLSNPMFLYEVDHDWLQRVRNVFWADAKSRMDCTYFGDVVCFDTSSVSNKNLFPFAPFIGVNHHGQSVLLGCSLILEDTPTSFAWVFKTWLTAMSGRSPAVIITNHDRNVKAAVAEVFPEARHCFSLWNILKKAPRKVGPFCRDYEKFTKEFEKCIYESMTAGEFERRWTELTEEFDLTRNKWLQMLYEDCQQWVPLFLKDTNFAGMSTFENINSFFDSSLSSKATWKEFVEHYETILQNRHEMEALAEFETFHSEPSLTTPSPFEEQLARVYTSEIFKKFRKEVLGYSACHALKIQEEGGKLIYTVKDLVARKDYTATWNGSETKVSCSCGLFEFRGFLCRHSLAVLIASGIYEIPASHILKRWTKEAKNQHELHRGCCPVSKVQRFNDICRRCIKFAEEGSLCERSYNVALTALQEALGKVVCENDSIERRFPAYTISEETQIDNRNSISSKADSQPFMECDNRTRSGVGYSQGEERLVGSPCPDKQGDGSQSDGTVKYEGASLASEYVTHDSSPQTLQLDLRVPDLPNQHAPQHGFQIMV